MRLAKSCSVMMVDEAHERTLHTDALFGLVKVRTSASAKPDASAQPEVASGASGAICSGCSGCGGVQGYRVSFQSP
jgi:hypothetical protein